MLNTSAMTMMMMTASIQKSQCNEQHVTTAKMITSKIGLVA